MESLPDLKVQSIIYGVVLKYTLDGLCMGAPGKPQIEMDPDVLDATCYTATVPVFSGHGHMALNSIDSNYPIISPQCTHRVDTGSLTATKFVFCTN